MSRFTKVLIANRGEIACRLIAAARACGLATVAVYSEADAGARHVRLADEAIAIGPGPAAESYLNAEKLLDAARQTGAQALHPGYGFLSERAGFARQVQAAGLVWIGPGPEVIELMGNKIAAKRAAEQAGVPTLPWAVMANGSGWSEADLKAAADRIGYPLLLKAAAGGGGRGMRLVGAAGELQDKAESAAREADSAFGSGELFLEAYCAAPRHVEVQILGDGQGTVVALGERECSVQRRHQKVIEEAPAPRLSPATRAALWKAAIDLGRSVQYANAGTCEFLVDEQERFYFLEVNTRLQVEHPVTEMVWGVDLPALQFALAQGDPLPDDLLKGLTPRGHAIEVRLYAEDPAHGFMPSPGRLEEFHAPHWAWLRVDTGYEPGSEVPIYYDAMLAKVIAWGADREQARRSLIAGLEQTRVVGVAWNGPYLLDIMRHVRFQRGEVDTRFLEQEFANWQGVSRTEAETPAQPPVEAIPTAWEAFGAGGSPRRGATGRSRSSAEGKAPQDIIFEGPLVAEYPGKVLKVLVGTGDEVAQGQVVVICESMKMEYSYAAPRAARVRTVHVQAGEVIPGGTMLVEWEEDEAT